MANPPAIFLEIDAAMRGGDIARAIALARQALDSGLSDPVLFNLRGYWHEANGRLEAALTDLARASAMAPTDPRTLVALGRCLAKLGRIDQALIVLDEAIRLAPAMATAHYERGFAREQAGALVPARANYEQALSLAPDMANAAARLASLAARRSDWAQAQQLADTALRIDPNDAVAQFALVMKDMAQGAFESAEARTRQVADAPATEPQARANALSFLADALDAQHRYAQAFDAYTQANDALREVFQHQFDGVETGLPLALRMRDALHDMPALTAPDAADANPVFVLGFARAGTTLLGQILASHPRFTVMEEKPLLLDAMTDFLGAPDGLQRLAVLSPAHADNYRALYWRRAREQGFIEGRTLVDQTPLHVLHLPLIARLFPGARIVVAQRDPRDVVLSCFRRLFVPNAYTCEFLSLDLTARLYDAAMACAELGRQKLPLAFHEMRNESLVADFEGEVRALCDFLGVAFDPAMAGFAARSKTGAVATPSATQIAKGLNSSGIGQWQHYTAQLAPVLPLLAPWVKKFGYDLA